ncbi:MULTISPECIES: class I SAM-dependent RNA methyltransferase [Cyanophyceae]|nr:MULTISPECIES: THUMP domain-containing protein [Cyanophyceae]ACA99670.1 Predicted N6-adenine-specific DNA methylase [Picosynechococcus sp. PCC 7002]SMH28301.1 putative N6-adenine-specific DNA methylase [Picosynechococcus sp. OG1]SMQ83549.1 putative N6-adenine-specific DNA methylase [Synechococcus sp. 7002]
MQTYFATVAQGIEELAAQELTNLGAQAVKTEYCGVSFQGDRQLLYKVNLWSRLAFRVLVQIRKVKAFTAKELYRGVQSIDWSEYLAPNQTIAVTCTGKNKNLNHTHFTALQVKNAIIDQQRDQFGDRSSVNVEDPDVLINAHIRDNRCTISLDSSGHSLHRRGYRPAMGKAPLKENFAAGLLDLAEWTPDLPLVDPLCGSGTFVIEAALKSLNFAPGLFQGDFGFQHWQDFDAELWQTLLNEAEYATKDQLQQPIIGQDRDQEVIQQAWTNAENCGVADHIQLACRELEQVEAPADRGVIICNPPYGHRLGADEDLGLLYKRIGDIFKQRFKGWTGYILTGNAELAKRVGLRASRRFVVYNGGLECRLLKYELY